MFLPIFMSVFQCRAPRKATMYVVGKKLSSVNERQRNQAGGRASPRIFVIEDPSTFSATLVLHHCIQFYQDNASAQKAPTMLCRGRMTI